MDGVGDRRGPAEPVAGVVAGAGGVGDRGDDPVGERVLDDEGEERLRQEARLERATAVLVRDAALAPVPDRLDDRHADMAGLLLDGVDHRLDPLPHDHRLDLDHDTPPRRCCLSPRKKPRDRSGHEAPSPRRPPPPTHRLTRR
jgi:hypothetical protein